MNDAQPRAEALAVKDGKVQVVGSRENVEAHKGPSTQVVDLAGKTITPGFIDGHGHLSMVGIFAAAANLLPPPDGKVTSIEAMQQTMREWMSSSHVPKKYGIAYDTGYDDSQLEEQRHATRDELDAISTDIPIYVSHQSGHLGVANSKALEVLTQPRFSPESCPACPPRRRAARARPPTPPRACAAGWRDAVSPIVR